MRALIAALCLLGGCVAAQATHPPVPPALAEQVPEAPPSIEAQIWQPGHYEWDGTAYLEVPGVWVVRAGHGTLWQDGFWRDNGRASEWVAGHWL